MPTAHGVRRGSARQPLILFAEDDRDLRMVYEEYFASEGFRVDGVRDGRAAWEHAIAVGCDLIVLDLGMPQYDGLQALHHLKTHPSTSHIPVIVCSALYLNRTVEKAMAAGCDGYVVKPCRLPDLLAEVRRALARSARNMRRRA
jgi:two-component system cell cycle response regulator DivK